MSDPNFMDQHWPRLAAECDAAAEKGFRHDDLNSGGKGAVLSQRTQPCALCSRRVVVDRQWRIVVCTACFEEYGEAAVQNWLRGWISGHSHAAAEFRPLLNQSHENLCKSEKRARELRHSRGGWKMLATMGWLWFLVLSLLLIFG